MKHIDMRKLPTAAQEERRRQVIGLRERGLSYEAIAAQVGLSQTGGIQYLPALCAGRPPVTGACWRQSKKRPSAR